MVPGCAKAVTASISIKIVVSAEKNIFLLILINPPLLVLVDRKSLFSLNSDPPSTPYSLLFTKKPFLVLLIFLSNSLKILSRKKKDFKEKQWKI